MRNSVQPAINVPLPQSTRPDGVPEFTCSAIAACGSGASTRALLRASRNGPTVLGVDLSEGMLEQARAKRWPDGVRFLRGRCGALDVEGLGPGSWHGVFASYLFRNVPADGRDLNYGKFVDQGEARLTQTTHGEDYNSHNTTRLDVDGMTQLLLKLEGMQRIARGETTTVEEC